MMLILLEGPGEPEQGGSVSDSTDNVELVDEVQVVHQYADRGHTVVAQSFAVTGIEVNRVVDCTAMNISLRSFFAIRVGERGVDPQRHIPLTPVIHQPFDLRRVQA